MHIRLTRTLFAETAEAGVHVWPLRVVASTTDTDIPATDPKIFVYHTDPRRGKLPVFEAVASIQNMQQIPDVETEGQAYFRSDTLNYPCLSPEERERLWEAVQQEVQWLTDNFAIGTSVGTDVVNINTTA